MTDVDKQFVQTLVHQLADEVEHRTRHGSTDATMAFYQALADSHAIASFRDPDFSEDMIHVMNSEWSVSKNETEASELKSLMDDQGVTDGQVKGHAASALSRLRRLTMANV